MIPYTELN